MRKRTISEFLKKPYPYIHNGNERLKIAALIFIVGYLFEYFIIPFERDPEEHLYSYAIISLWHVGTAVIVYYVYFSILSIFIQDDDWLLYKEFIVLFFLLPMIGIAEWAIRDLIYNNPYNHRMFVLKEEVIHAYLSGSVIFILMHTVYANILSRNNIHHAQELHLNKTSNTDQVPIEIKTQISSENFTVPPDQIVCVKSDGNYVEFYLFKETIVTKEIKRMTLTNVMSQLESNNSMIRTHRAFIVNKNFIESINGNAQGYQLTLKGMEFIVPVSRKNLDSFNRAMT